MSVPISDNKGEVLLVASAVLLGWFVFLAGRDLQDADSASSIAGPILACIVAVVPLAAWMIYQARQDPSAELDRVVARLCREVDSNWRRRHLTRPAIPPWTP